MTAGPTPKPSGSQPEPTSPAGSHAPAGAPAGHALELAPEEAFRKRDEFAAEIHALLNDEEDE